MLLVFLLVGVESVAVLLVVIVVFKALNDFDTAILPLFIQTQ